MDISVIICTYNRGAFLRKVLLDLAGQDAVERINFEVVIVDNNSTDNTKLICEEFIATHPEIFRYFFEERQGKTFALNSGIRASKGNVIAFTDDDVEIDRKWLSSITEACAAYPDCRTFGGRVIPVWPNTVPRWIASEGAFKNTWGAIVEHDFGDMVTNYRQEEMNYPCGANMVFSKEIFTQYGDFNESLNGGVKNIPMLEDVEFCKRLLDNHENMIYIPDAVVYHPVIPERLTKKYFRKHFFKSGRAQYFIRNLQRRGRYVVLNLRKNRRRVLNVPLYFVRAIGGILSKYVVTVCSKNAQAAQYYENMLVYNIGIMYECFVQRKNNQMDHGNT